MPRRYVKTTGRPYGGGSYATELTVHRLAMALEEELERPTFTELIKIQDLKLQQLKEQMFGGVSVAHMRLQVEQPVPLSILVDPSVNSALAISTHFNDHQQSTVLPPSTSGGGNGGGGRSGEDDGDIDFSKAEDFLQLETPIDARRDHNVLKIAYSIPPRSFMSYLLRRYPTNKKRLAFIQRRPHTSKASQINSAGASRKGEGKETSISCQVCGQRFTRQHLFQQHILTHPDPENKIFLCQICGKRFNRADHLNRHSLLHQVSVFKCHQCGEEFDRASHLDRHRRKNHPPVGHIPTHTPPTTPKSGKTPTSSGSGVFVTPNVVTSHPSQQPSGSNLHLLASVATPESVSAGIAMDGGIMTPDGEEGGGEGGGGEARFQFINLVDPEDDIVQTASSQSTTPKPHPSNEKPEPERPFLCSVCNHRFIRATHLRRHMRIHTGEKPFTCHICGQRYARGDYLRAHIQAHRRDRIHKCKHCGEAFHDLTRFADHCRVMHRDANDEFGNPCPPPEYSPPPPPASVTLESTLAMEAAEEITVVSISELTGQQSQLMPTTANTNVLSHHPITAVQNNSSAVAVGHLGHTPSPTPQADMIQMTLVNIPEPSPPSPDVIITSHIQPQSSHHTPHQYHSSPNEMVAMPTLQTISGGHTLHNGTHMGVVADHVTMATPKPLPTLYDANDPILQYIIANGNQSHTPNGPSQPLHH